MTGCARSKERKRGKGQELTRRGNGEDDIRGWLTEGKLPSISRTPAWWSVDCGYEVPCTDVFLLDTVALVDQARRSAMESVLEVGKVGKWDSRVWRPENPPAFHDLTTQNAQLPCIEQLAARGSIKLHETKAQNSTRSWMPFQP